MIVTSCVNVRVPLASPTRTHTAFSDMMLKLDCGDEDEEETIDPCNEFGYLSSEVAERRIGKLLCCEFL